MQGVPAIASPHKAYLISSQRHMHLYLSAYHKTQRLEAFRDLLAKHLGRELEAENLLMPVPILITLEPFSIVRGIRIILYPRVGEIHKTTLAPLTPGESGTRKQARQTNIPDTPFGSHTASVANFDELRRDPPPSMEDSLIPADTFSALARLRAFAEAELGGHAVRMPLPRLNLVSITALALATITGLASAVCRGCSSVHVIPAVVANGSSANSPPGPESMELMPRVGRANAIPDPTAEVSFNINGTEVKFTGSGYHARNRGSSPIYGRRSEYGRFGPYSVVCLDTLNTEGTEHVFARQRGLSATQGDVPDGFQAEFDTGEAGVLEFDAIHTADPIPTEDNHANCARGGVVWSFRSQLQILNGTASYEQFMLVEDA
ncbi:hypothetical protein DL769_011400 [Monosporascus sp. CRB-8-3]|nr:hypothetical protein DL769_011400 [Monosporascus sp. CRB-8-3]